MPQPSPLGSEFVHDYGEAYRLFGLPRLMGHVVGLLLSEPGSLSLDEITERLQVSKGPVSQVMRRLRDHGLVEKRWVPGSRRDYYRAVPDIFGRAFANHAALLQSNLELARKYAQAVRESDQPVPEHFANRIEEMERFYALMHGQLEDFLGNWQQEWEAHWRGRVGSEDNGPMPAQSGEPS